MGKLFNRLKAGAKAIAAHPNPKEIYGKKSYIKVHNVTFGISDDSVLIELVVVLGDTINEETLDTSLADVLLKEALVYFWPEKKVRTLVRWDV